MESICIVNISGSGDSPNLCQLASGDNIVSFYGRGHDSLERVTVYIYGLYVMYSTLILLMETFNFVLSLVSLWTSQDLVL